MAGKTKQSHFPLVLAANLFYAGYNHTRIAAELGSYSRSLISRELRQLGLTWGNGGKPTSTKPRATRRAARRAWERAYGPIPKGWVIHHIDGDRTNNALSNLELLSDRDHTIKHYPSVLWSPEERRKRQRQWAAKSYKKHLVAYTCEHCKKEFFRARFVPNPRFCSRRCATFNRYVLLRAQEAKSNES